MDLISENVNSTDFIKPHGLLDVSLEITQYYDNDACIVVFDCLLKNIGNSDIALGNTYLFIDEGYFDNSIKVYVFPFLQKKFLNIPGISNDDCIMCDNCRKSNPSYPRNVEYIQDYFCDKKDLYTNCISLSHLSSSSVLHMSPNETFNDIAAVRLSKGIFRAILVSVPKSDNCDCMCKNKCFFISGND